MSKTKALPSIKSILPKLQELGVVTVVVEYSGCGDQGAIDSVTAYDVGDDDITLPKDFENIIEIEVYSYLPRGYEDGDGGRGELTIDVAAAKVQLHAVQYYMSENAADSEFMLSDAAAEDKQE